MQSAEGADASVRTVVEGCAARKVLVSDELASVFYKGYALSSQVVNADSLRKKLPAMNKYAEQKVVERCIETLCVPEDPAVLCVKMQLILEHDYRDKDFIINKINENNGRRIDELVKKIVDIGHHTNDEESSKYYRRIVQYVILTNYMGDPTSQTNIQETFAALTSVVGPKKLLDFDNQLQSSKRKQLKEFADLACGMMVYVMDQKTSCKEEIFNMIEALPSAVDLLLQNANQELENCLKKEISLTLRILQCYKVDHDFFAPLFAIRIRIATVKSDELIGYKTVLLFYLQYKRNLKTIRKDLNKYKIELIEVLNKYSTTLRSIKHYIKNSNDSNVEEICPELINMSTIWNKILEIMNYLSTTTNLLLTMKKMTELQEIDTNNQIDYSHVTEIFPAVNDEQLKIIEMHPLHPMCKWYPPNSNTVNLFAQGYCVVMIVETDGTLIKHNRNVGTIQYLDKLLGFTSIQAALHFSTKPIYYLNCFYNLLRTRVPLSFFFHLQEKLADKNCIVDELRICEYNGIQYSDAQVQTMPHLHNVNKTEGYFNRQMKQYTHQLNEVPETVTRSAQTVDVYKSIYVQTGSYDVGCNTMKEKGTNTEDQSINALISFNF